MITPLEKVPFFSDWLSAVSVGYQLEQLQGISSAALNDLEAESVYEAIERIVDLWSLYTGQNSVREFMCLPLVTIQQLAKINHPSLEKVSSTATAARDLLLRREKDGSSLVLKAKLVLDRLIAGTHTPLQAIGLLKAELGVLVKRDVAHLEALDLFMQEASRPNPQLLSQVMALDRLGALVGRGRGHWRLLENCLLQASFTWPLFVIDTGQDNSHQVVGTSLPFLIELKIPEKALKGNRQQKVAILGDSDADFGARLRATAETALSAATGAWQNQNSDWFLDFHDRLNSADGIVDIRYAQKVRELAGYDPKFPIAGRSLRSMEAHLALKFFGALADPHGMDYTCATGALRPRRGFIDKSDFEVSPTSGTIGKLERATLAASFDRVCVPNERGSTDLIKVNVPANLSIVRGKYFSDFAQSVFPADFSRNTFIRCPDLAQAWNSDIPCYFVDASEVESARQAIHGANEPVLVLDRSHSPAAVARALYLDNADHERNADLIRNSTGYKDLVRNEDFLQSFAFIRAVDYETNERFWRVVWELLSGRDMEWDRFCFPVSTVQPAKMLAQLLNRTYSTQARPRRVPDKIVIVGSDYLSRKILGCPTGPFARLQMRSLLPELNANIGQIKPSYITDNLGMARIILVPEDSQKTAGAISILEIPEAFRSSVRKLVIFQYGFSFAVAKTHLGMDDWDAAMELRRMLGFAVGGVPLLSKIRGTMFAFNFTVNIEALPVIEKARGHVKVARSLLGLAGGSVDMGHADFRRSLSAVSVHEAEFHLATALRGLQVDVNGNGPLWNEATDLRIRINRLSEPFSWTRVRFAASQKGKDDESRSEERRVG